MARQDVEMSGLQHVAVVPPSLVHRQEFPAVGAVFLLCRAQLHEEEGEGLPDALHSLLEDVTRGGG